MIWNVMNKYVSVYYYNLNPNGVNTWISAMRVLYMIPISTAVCGSAY